MNDIEFTAVTFVDNGNALKGHYFYYITLPNALKKMNELGIEVLKNYKMTIAVYPNLLGPRKPLDIL